MPTDAELLRRYADEKSEGAFAELVSRQVNLVHAVALRQCGGDAHLAEDVTQRVFTDLARKARQLSGHAVLGGWLYRSAQFAASDVVRAERRRRAREQEASTMQEILSDHPPGGTADWQKLAPVLDAAIGELSERDRDAVVLRFFEGRPFAEIGAALRLSEDAARMRVDRALDKLHGALRRRGIASTTAALGVALAGQAAGAAPAGLAASVTGAALAGSAAATGGGVIAIFMSMTKLQVGIGAALLLAGGTGLVVQTRANAELREEIAGLRQENAAIAPLRAENIRLARSAAEAVDLRGDDAELQRLGDESAKLERQWQQLDQARAAAATAKANAAAKGYHAPVLKSPIPPQYPAEMLQAGIEGEVTVEFVVNREGKVVDAFAVGSTRREFETAVTDAVSQWEYSAAQMNQRPVNTRVRQVVTFRLDKTTGRAVDGSVSVRDANK
ncbi:MAG: TonB family protein [Verrucomicrobia bacterium]|nr:TonB family protein [Verrucomicrobiota bacterium]